MNESKLMELVGLACAQNPGDMLQQGDYPRVLVGCGPGNHVVMGSSPQSIWYTCSDFFPRCTVRMALSVKVC